MKNFRKAALAAATATTIAFGSASVASAQSADDTATAPNANLSSQIESSSTDSIADQIQGSDSTGSHNFFWKIGKILGADGKITGEDLLGSTQEIDQKAWGPFYKFAIGVAVVGAVAGAIIGAVNWAKFHGILPR